MSNLVFDIETVKLEQEEMPFLPRCFSKAELPPMPEFTSKYTADIAKREADINEKIRKWRNDEESKIIQQRLDFMDSAALSPDFGRIAAIGIASSTPESSPPESFNLLFSEDSDEREIIEQFLAVHANAIRSGNRVAGYNSLGFDYPFLYWRAVILGVPQHLLESAGIKFHPKWGLQLPGNCFDLMSIAQSRPMRGPRADLKYDSMNQVCKALGLGEKLGDGADFHSLSREHQEAYLHRDCELTLGIARKLLPYF